MRDDAFLVGVGGRLVFREAMADPIYKVMTEAAFEAVLEPGAFRRARPTMLRDGFIHLSAAHQLEGTLAKYFAGQEGLVLLAVDAGRLAPT